MNERIKELRKALGLSGEKFGERLGVGKTAISRIENGSNGVTDQMFKSICREFNVNEDWLRNDIGPMFKTSDDEFAECVADMLTEDNPLYDAIKKIMITYRKLDSTSKDVIDKLINDAFNSQKKKRTNILFFLCTFSV